MIKEARSKCALCNETLTHIVKMAEVASGAGMATITRELADKVNENAAPLDKVSGNALNQRVRQHEGLKMSERQNKPTATPEPKPRRQDHQVDDFDAVSPAFAAAWDALYREIKNAKALSRKDDPMGKVSAFLAAAHPIGILLEGLQAKFNQFADGLGPGRYAVAVVETAFEAEPLHLFQDFIVEGNQHLGAFCRHIYPIIWLTATNQHLYLDIHGLRD